MLDKSNREIAKQKGIGVNSVGNEAHLQVPLIAHIIHMLDIGGMENGVVNLINNIDPNRYRHVVICLTNFTDFRLRIQQPSVQVFALNKKEGKDLFVYVKLWWLLRKIKPDIVHTRNFAALEGQVCAFLAGVACRIHGEHGWNMGDLRDGSWKRRSMRKLLKVFVGHYIALSKHIETYLKEQINISPIKISQIYNGVNTEQFSPANERHTYLPVNVHSSSEVVVIGTVGRMQPIKDQLTLVRAFLWLLEAIPEVRQRLRLVLIGDGPLRAQAAVLIKEAGAEDLVWMPGYREDVANILQGLDIFVLPSLAEGVSNTILEAMASRLPVIATRVGGNPELVEDDVTGMLVPSADPVKMAEALRAYVLNADVMLRHGLASRKRVENAFSLARMVEAYVSVYDTMLKKHGRHSGTKSGIPALRSRKIDG